MLAPLRVIDDPAPGQIVECPVASCVQLRFSTGLATRWQVEERPGHLAPISQGTDAAGYHVTFVIFAEADDERPLRLVRVHPDQGTVEERSLRIVTDAPARPSRGHQNSSTAAPELWGAREAVG